MKREKIIGTVVVLIVVLGFLRCVEGLLWDPGPPGWGGAGGTWSTDAGIDAGIDAGEAVCPDGICAPEENVTTCPEDCDHDLVVVVEEALSGTLASSLDTYVDDLRREGSVARVEPWRPGTVEELKAFLFDQVDRYGIEGALLIGNLPAAFYEHRVICTAWDRINRCVWFEYEEFPTDVYLQDRAAEWDDADGDGLYDSHGDLNLEIFVSRLQTVSDPVKCGSSELYPECPESYDPSEELYASEQCVLRCPSRLQAQPWQEHELGDVECCGPYFLRRYFERLHEYRTEGALVNRSALLFADDDFVQMVKPTGLETLYTDVQVLTDPSDTTQQRYVDELTMNGAELVHHLTHSTVRNLYFYTCTDWDADQPSECLRWGRSLLNRTQISSGPFAPSYNLKVSFANMYNCHASRFTEPNLGMAFTVQTDYGLATVGNTREGGMTDPSVFHGELGKGTSWGESYRRWYNEVGKHDDRWYLGVVIMGDPMLTIPLVEGARNAAGLVTQEGQPTETPPEITAADPPGTFEAYKRQNPQFFKTLPQ